MHEARSAVHFAAVDGAEALMPEADSQHRNFARKIFDGFGRNAAVFERFAWTWGDDEVVRFEGDEFVQRDLVVAVDADVRAEFAEVLHEVVGE